MAQITKKIGKNGKISFVFRVSDGYDINGKQRKRSMTWEPPEGTTPKKAEKLALAESLKFEQLVQTGTIQNDTIRLAQFAEKWMREYAELQLKAKTVDSYWKNLERINNNIGHIRLRDLKTAHINAFYADLQKDGSRSDTKYRAIQDIHPLFEKHHMSVTAFCKVMDLNPHTFTNAMNGKNISIHSANKISQAFKVSRSNLFAEAPEQQKKLSAKTVRTVHSLLSSMLSKAVKWGYIETNPATNAELPRLGNHEAAYLDEDDSRRLLVLLQKEPIKFRVPISFDLLSGLRRGELLGLRWSDVDFEKQTITIQQTSSYVKSRGVYVDTPKNHTSARPLKLSRSVFALLYEYKTWQDENKLLCGDRWKDKDGRIFTSEEGTPLHPDSLSKWFRDFCNANGFEGIHIHSLRHSYASLMIADGTPLVVVSKRMGHAQTSTTANIYAHVIRSADETASQITEKFADVLPEIPDKTRLA